jgi:hypothetical protein
MTKEDHDMLTTTTAAEAALDEVQDAVDLLAELAEARRDGPLVTLAGVLAERVRAARDVLRVDG